MNWKRVGAVLGMIGFVELGARIGLIGVDHVALMKYFDEGGTPFLLSLYMFAAGGGLFRAGVLGLGVMPYLSARVFMRLMRVVSPEMQALAKSEEGHDTLRRRTRWLTGALSVIQSIGFATFLQRVPGAVADPGPGFIATTVLTLTAGSLVAMWLGEKLTDRESHYSQAPEVIPAVQPVSLPANNEATRIDPDRRTPANDRAGARGAATPGASHDLL